jgi:hypothetical protein
MAIQSLTLKLTGNSIIPHSGQTADPRNSFAKAMKLISGKRKKTDSDLDELARLEFLAGLYLEDGQIVLPSYVLEASLIAGAKKSKRGVQAKTALFIERSSVLEFDGKPEVINEGTLSDLFEAGKHHLSVGVKVGMSKVIRTRPHLRNWSTTVDIDFEDEFVNRAEVIDFATDAGRQVGLCDWRPKHGRFGVEVVA